ncbi:MAG: fibronectin type III domain-containing protein, partial [Candidatus Sulfotelmatobacter sp.]
GYTVYENENGNYTSIGTATGTTFPVTGLTPSTTYSFTVAASDSAGLSAQSSPASVMTLTAGTPIATYTITITGTDANNLTHSTMVNLTLN